MSLIPKSGLPRVLALEVLALLLGVLGAIPFAVWRYGRAAMPLAALLLCALCLLGAALAALAACTLRARLPRLDARAPPLPERLAAAAPELGLAVAYALVWGIAGLVPAEARVAAELVMPLEALALLGACLAVPVLRARARRIGDTVAVGLIVLLAAALAWGLAERSGATAWVVLGVLACWRAWSLERRRRREPLNEQERWLFALGVLVASYWLATLARAFAPLPGAGFAFPVRGAAAAPEPWVLLWGLAHFGGLACLGLRGWPLARAEQEPPPPPRAFAQPRRGPK